MDWATRSIVDEAHDRAGLARVSWVEVNDLSILLDFVGSGLGIAIVPGPEALRAETSTATDKAEQKPAVSHVPLVPRGPAWTFCIVTKGSTSSNPAARAFTETLKRLRPDAGSLSLTVDDDQIGLRG
jgi:DNA-binding transcriptional LysR family regulator